VKLGSIFVAYPGTAQDGRAFIPEAIARGAAAVIWERRGFEWEERWEIPDLGVEGLRGRLSEIAGHIYGNPSEQLLMIGVTGTNGKTSVSQWIAAACESLGRRAAVIGTLGNGLVGERVEAKNTTPDAIVLQRLLADYLRRGARVAAMEVSSHGLDQSRVAGIKYDVGVFTNLTRDHLDYHQTMEKYFAAKRLLFDGTIYPAPRVSVLNAHDERTPDLIEAARAAGSEVRTYGLGVGDFQAVRYRLRSAGATFDLESPAGSARIVSKLAGEVNILNLLAAFTAAHARGVPFDQLVRSSEELHPVPGRFQSVDAGQPFTVIVDYAHTDDALRNLTALARQLVANTKGRVVTVFGCGGDRDRTKRPKMGYAAGEGSDFVVATSDNPRSEDPRAILAEIEPALKATGVQYIIEPDRAAAIALAIKEAHMDDVILLAGKGHEKEQIIGARAIPFDDSEVALAALRDLGYGGMS